MDGKNPIFEKSNPAPTPGYDEAKKSPSILNEPSPYPKLGDFASLQSATIGFNPPHHLLSHSFRSGSGAKLGDLSKVVDQLRALDSAGRKTALQVHSDASPEVPSPAIASVAPRDDLSSYYRSDSEVQSTIITKGTGMASYAPTQPSPLQQRLPGHMSAESPTKEPNSKRPRNEAFQLVQIFSYKTSEAVVAIPVFDVFQTARETYKSLRKHVAPLCAMDRSIAKKFPDNTSRGVHVFLDLSNIEISFQRALREKYNLADNTRFSPLPRLNLRFLTEILIRGRESRNLRVGCSIVPKSREPKYVQDLRDLGYSVDVRERKRVEATGLGITQNGTRYVEELVDETLQTRMAEAVMEHFQEQGTIVLATGDAKPAQYSDGFFRYAERALRMGWNVELISWQSSLSSSWRDANWAARWGVQFRVIELDNFVKDLLEPDLRSAFLAQSQGTR